MHRLLGLVAASVIVLSVAPAAACSVPRIRTFDNQTSHGQMTVRSGRTCRITFLSSTGPMHAVEVVQRPQNGTLQVGGYQSVTYKSRAGYVGADSFTYARRGLDKRGNPSKRTVEVSVTVRP